jgi:hypothetical protein
LTMNYFELNSNTNKLCVMWCHVQSQLILLSRHQTPIQIKLANMEIPSKQQFLMKTWNELLVPPWAFIHLTFFFFCKQFGSVGHLYKAKLLFDYKCYCIWEPNVMKVPTMGLSFLTTVSKLHGATNHTIMHQFVDIS